MENILSATEQIQKQIDNGNRTISVISATKTSPRARKIETQIMKFTDLTLSGETDREFVIDYFHKYSSVLHWYGEGSTSNSPKTLESIESKTQLLAQIPTGSVSLVNYSDGVVNHQFVTLKGTNIENEIKKLISNK